MAALGSGPKSRSEIVSATGFSAKVVRGLVDRAVAIGVAEPLPDGRVRLIADLDIASVIEASGAAKLQQRRREEIEADRAWREWQEEEIARVIPRHGLTDRGRSVRSSVHVLLPATDRETWRRSRIRDSTGEEHGESSPSPGCIS